MPKVTGVLGMALPEPFDKVDVNVLSDNFQLIDNAFGKSVTLDHIAYSLEETEEGKVLDARVGPDLVEALAAVAVNANQKINAVDAKSSGRAEALLARINTKARITTHKITIASDEWTKNEESGLYEAVVEIEDVTEDDSKTAIIVTPPSDRKLESVYAKYETRATGKGNGEITFTCEYDEAPSEDIEANVMVIILGGEDTELPDLDLGDGESGDAGEDAGTGDIIIDGSGIIGGNNVCIINVSQLESGLYTADKTLNEVNTAYDLNKVLYCRREVDSETFAYVFTGVDVNGYHFARHTGENFEILVLGEAGIEIYDLGSTISNGGGIYYVDIIESDTSETGLTLTATSEELRTAYEAKSAIYCRRKMDENTAILMPLAMVVTGESTSEDTFVFATNVGEVVIGVLYTNGEAAYNEITLPTEDSINTAVGEALQTAKDNGEFSGQDGKDGVSPTITAVKENGVATLTIKNADNSISTVTIENGADGPTGITPAFSIGTITTGEAGTKATASITGTVEKPVLNLTIPKGDKGANGSNGSDGFSPTIVANKTGKVTTLTITDVNGTRTADINDGADGSSVSANVNLEKGEASGSIRGVNAAEELDDYKLGASAVALGRDTKASGEAAFATGYNTSASGDESTAEGSGTTASGRGAHAEGFNTVASGIGAHAEGYHTIASKNYQHVQGQFNAEDTEGRYVHIQGDGYADYARSNAHTIDKYGNAWFKGDVYVKGTSQDDAVKLVTKTELDEAVQSVNSGDANGTTAATVSGEIIFNTSGTGTDYTATIEGVEESEIFKTGRSMVMIPHVTSTSKSGITLNINGSGVEPVYRRSTDGSSMANGGVNGWLSAGRPYRIMWCDSYWVVTDYPQAKGTDISGIIPIANGGTNASDAATALANLGGVNAAYVDQKIADLVDSAPGTLNTLNELAAALGDDPNYATTIATKIGQLESKVDAIDYPVDSVNGKTGAVVLTANDVGALPNTTVIPSVEGLATEEYVAAQLQNIADGQDVIPAYWQEHLDERILDVRSALETAGRNKAAFLWWDDAHWSYNYKQSPMLLKYLSKHTCINKTFYGGDVLDAEDGVVTDDGSFDLSALGYVYDWRDAIRDIPNHFSVVGNHDDGNGEFTDGELPGNFTYAFLFAPEEQRNIVYGEGFYYYFDEPAEKTRYIFLDTATKVGSIVNDPAQKVFVREALKSTPRGWHIVPIAHIWLQVDYDVSPPTVTDFSLAGTMLLEMFDNYNTRQGEYATCTAKVEFCIGGHSHVDNTYLSSTGIPVILTECDCRNVRSGLTCKEGTITENSVNAIVADYTNKVVNVVRIGRGESRTVPINHTGISYTNQLPIATDADGNIYNEIGYKENTRVNSSNEEVSVTGWDVTGFIPVQAGDVIRFSNMTFFDLTNTEANHYAMFTFYDSSYTRTNSSDRYSLDNLLSDAWNAVYGENEDLIQCTLPTNYGSAVRYVRIGARDLNENSIITVNEVIE